MGKPPPPLPDKRRWPRVEIFAQVEFKLGTSVKILRVRDASEGGLFIEAVPADHPTLKVGSSVEMMLVPEDDTTDDPIELTGTIARIDPGGPGRASGFGIDAKPTSDADEYRLKALLARARAR